MKNKNYYKLSLSQDRQDNSLTPDLDIKHSPRLVFENLPNPPSLEGKVGTGLSSPRRRGAGGEVNPDDLTKVQSTLQTLSKKEQILVVDDTPANLKLVSDFLRESGFEVRVAKSGIQALKIVEAASPDLILLDVMMPEMDGFETCSRLKALEQAQDIPVIFMTAVADSSEPTYKVKGLTLGAVDYISKPIQLEEVLARVKTHLHLRSLTKQLQEQNGRLQHEIHTRKQTEVILQQEISDREQAEAALRESAIRLRKQNKVLMELARHEALNQGHLKTALKAITEATAYNIAVERVSVWLFDKTGTLLQCLDLFEQSFNRHSEGVELVKADYPAYFQALAQNQLIVADEAHIDPQTSEFSESYLTPLGITSMLDAPIRLKGQTVGVVCHEHVGATRCWTPEDQNFARSIADLVSLALEAQERKRAEEALIESEANLKIAQRVAHVGSWKFDVPTQKITWSEELFRIYGLDPTKPEPTYAEHIEFIHPDDQALWQQTIGKAIADGISYEFDFQIVQPDDQVRYIEGRGEAIVNDAGQVTRLVGTARDITERKQAEQALRKSEAREREKAKELELALERLKRTQAQLIQAEKMSSLGRMIAGVAHEINNPISFISCNLTPATEYFQDLLKLIELYQQTYPNPTPAIEQLTNKIELNFLIEDWSKLMDSIQVGTERIRQIVLSLRSFSKLDEQELKPVDIHEGIDSTLLILQHRMRKVGASAARRDSDTHQAIEVIKDYGQLPKVTCYASQLNQVFMHLLSNAIDTLETQPFPRKIAISTSVASRHGLVFSGNNQQITNYVVIRIADNGSGMSEEVVHKMFDPFFSTKPVGSGTGLGLSISYQIVVEKHKGQISCISALGQGTEMIVEIPVNCQ